MLYHHGIILNRAKKTYERSLKDDDESFVSIMLSAMALECYINDFTHSASQELFQINIKPLRDLSYVLNVLESSRSTLISKIESIHFLLTGSEIDKGSMHIQDLVMLIRLRNELVHRKPESHGDWGVKDKSEFEPHKFVKYFSDRGIIDRPPSNAPPVWSQFINQPIVAKWAYNTVVHNIKDIIRILPPSHFAQIESVCTGSVQEIK